MKLLLSTFLAATSLFLAPIAASAADLRVWPKLTSTKTGEVAVTCGLYLVGASPRSHYVAVLSSGERFDVWADASGCGYITTLRTTAALGSQISGTVKFLSPEGMDRGELEFSFPVKAPGPLTAAFRSSMRALLWVTRPVRP